MTGERGWCPFNPGYPEVPATLGCAEVSPLRGMHPDRMAHVASHRPWEDRAQFERLSRLSFCIASAGAVYVLSLNSAKSSGRKCRTVGRVQHAPIDWRSRRAFCDFSKSPPATVDITRKSGSLADAYFPCVVSEFISDGLFSEREELRWGSDSFRLVVLRVLPQLPPRANPPGSFGSADRLAKC